METALLKIEMHEDGRISVHVQGQLNTLANMLASAISEDNAFNEVMTMAMMGLVMHEEHQRQEEINKAQLN
jgi:acylphosphatase